MLTQIIKAAAAAWVIKQQSFLKVIVDSTVQEKVVVGRVCREGLVVGMRSMPGNPYDGHTLYETLEQTTILTDTQPKEVFTDLGYRGAQVQPGIKVFHHKLKRNITQRLRRDIRRRSAIEPVIGAHEERRQIA